MTITASGYEIKYFETYIAVDPDTLQKRDEPPSKEFPWIITITLSMLSIGVVGIVGIFLVRKRRKEV